MAVMIDSSAVWEQINWIHINKYEYKYHLSKSNEGAPFVAKSKK